VAQRRRAGNDRRTAAHRRGDGRRQRGVNGRGFGRDGGAVGEAVGEAVGTTAARVRLSEQRRRARGMALSGDGGAGEAGAVGRERGMLSRRAAPDRWGPLSVIFELKITPKENSSKQKARD
jgi:hypothetical protein